MCMIPLENGLNVLRAFVRLQEGWCENVDAIKICAVCITQLIFVPHILWLISSVVQERY